MMISKTSLHDMGAAPVDPETVIAAAIIESVAKTAWKNGVNVQHANGGPGSCFGRTVIRAALLTYQRDTHHVLSLIHI